MNIKMFHNVNQLKNKYRFKLGSSNGSTWNRILFLALFLKTVPPYHLYYIDLSFCVFFISYQIILSAKAIINFNWSSYFV